MNDNSNAKIVGFDLGHGETSVSICTLDDNARPQDLEVWGGGMKSVITAVGWHPEQGVVVGNSALTNAKVEKTRICFKGDPKGRAGETKDATDERNGVVQAYFKAWCDKLAQNNQVSADGATKYYVGCPSGWSPESISCYKKMLAEIGGRDITIVKESRAGFVNTVESGTSTLALEDLRKDVLIVDIGSSTTDLTLVHDLLDEDFGNPQLGAALIDQTLFRRTLEQSAARAPWEAAFAKNSKLRARCEIACRKAKEIYFRSEQDYLDDPTLVASQGELVAGLGEFRPMVDAATMNSVLDEAQSSLGGRSWRGAFRGTLLEARKKLADRSIKLAALVLTGGPSRMRFTREMCREIFPEAHFQFDSDPEFCISRGLAYAGRYDTRTNEFAREVQAISKSDTFKKVMRNRLPALITLLVDAVADGLTDNAIKPSIEAWKEGRIKTLQDLEGITDGSGNEIKEGYLARAAKTWMEGGHAQGKLRDAVVRWFETVQPEIYAAGIDTLSAKYHLPTGKLRPDIRGDLKKLLAGQKIEGLDVVDLDFINNLLGAIVVIITAMVVHAVIIAIHIASGPFAWITAIVVGAYAAIWGMDEAKKKVKTSDIPTAMRGAAFFLKSVNERCDEMKPKLKETVRQQLNANSDGFQPLIDGLQALIAAELEKKADEVRVFIGMVGGK